MREAFNFSPLDSSNKRGGRRTMSLRFRQIHVMRLVAWRTFRSLDGINKLDDETWLLAASFRPPTEGERHGRNRMPRAPFRSENPTACISLCVNGNRKCCYIGFHDWNWDVILRLKAFCTNRSTNPVYLLHVNQKPVRCFKTKKLIQYRGRWIRIAIFFKLFFFLIRPLFQVL